MTQRPTVLGIFGKDRLTVTRQMPCHPGDNHTLDMALAVNGMLLARSSKQPGFLREGGHSDTRAVGSRVAHPPS